MPEAKSASMNWNCGWLVGTSVKLATNGDGLTVVPSCQSATTIASGTTK